MNLNRVSAATAVAFALTLLGPLPAQASVIDPSFGYDVSWPQCNSVLPTDGAFKVIGVNGGRPFGDNPCFQQQLLWAGPENAQLYLNTANPGPELSSFWPTGQMSPRECRSTNPDTKGCAFNYGYNFAKYSHEFIVASYQDLGLTYQINRNFIWIDVETENTWRASSESGAFEKNVAALKGAVYYLEKVAGITKIGFYSNAFQWGEITGSTLDFTDYPSWVATASNPQLGIEKCSEILGFTGGRILLAQYIDQELMLDVNVDCLNSPKLTTSLTELAPASAKAGDYITLRVKLKSETSSPLVGKKVTFRFQGQNYRVTTNKKGVAKKVVRASSKKGTFSLRATFSGSRYFLETNNVAEVSVR